MTSNAAIQEEPAPIMACTISRDVQNFDLLIEDMEAECGESWGDLSFEDAELFLRQPDSESLEFVAIAIDQEDEENIDLVADLVKAAKESDTKVIVIAEEVSPIALHKLLKIGAEEFVPYPLPDGALHDAIERMRRNAQLMAAASEVPDEMRNKLKATGDRDGVVLPVQGLSGGTGTTTFAVNLAWELANIEPVVLTQHALATAKRHAFACSTSTCNSGRCPPILTCPAARPCLNFCKTRHRWTATALCRRF